MKRIYRREGKSFWPTSSAELTIEKSLPPGTYLVRHNEVHGYYVDLIADFELPPKLYGEVNRQADRILNTARSRAGSTGVLLSGQKGSGKTMLTKRISQLALQRHQVPTLVVNENFRGDEFNAFIGGIDQAVVVLFDEFEKVYDRNEQAQLLTLFDGVFSSHKLFLLTCNNRNLIDTNLVNRPGRLYYSLDFTGLSQEFIKEYCEDKLEHKTDSAGVVAVSAFFHDFSFDMLQALVEEMNRYKESAQDAMKMLNMRPHHEHSGVYEVKAYRAGKPLLCSGQSHDTVDGSPLGMVGEELSFYSFSTGEEPEGGLTECKTYLLDANNLQAVNIDHGTFVFRTHEPEVTVHFVRRRYSDDVLNYGALAAA